MSLKPARQAVCQEKAFPQRSPQSRHTLIHVKGQDLLFRSFSLSQTQSPRRGLCVLNLSNKRSSINVNERKVALSAFAISLNMSTQHSRQTRPAETVRNDTALPIHSKLKAIADDVGVLSTFQQDGAAVLGVEHLRSFTNSIINNFQDLSSNMNHAAVAHIHPISAGGYSDTMWHDTPSPPTEAAQYVGGHVNVPARESHHSSTAPTSVSRDLTGCHSSAGQDVRLNSHTADFRWSGVFGTTWDSNLGQGEPFNEEMVDQRWMGGFGPAYNWDLHQGLLSNDQMADQQWSSVFGNGWHSYPRTSGQRSQHPLHDASLNTLNIPQRTRT